MTKERIIEIIEKEPLEDEGYILLDNDVVREILSYLKETHNDKK